MSDKEQEHMPIDASKQCVSIGAMPITLAEMALTHLKDESVRNTNGLITLSAYAGVKWTGDYADYTEIKVYYTPPWSERSHEVMTLPILGWTDTFKHRDGEERND